MRDADEELAVFHHHDNPNFIIQSRNIDISLRRTSFYSLGQASLSGGRGFQSNKSENFKLKFTCASQPKISSISSLESVECRPKRETGFLSTGESELFLV